MNICGGAECYATLNFICQIHSNALWSCFLLENLYKHSEYK